MKTKEKPQFISIGRKRLVILEEGEYRRLTGRAEEWEPPLPPLTPEGNYPAKEAMRVSIARTILRRRRALGLTQAELARRSRIRPETLNRIEQAKRAPTITTLDRIDRALKKAEAEDRE